MFSGLLYALSIDAYMSEIKQRLGHGATCAPKFLRKKLQPPIISPSTRAKATGKMLQLTSYATTISNVPLYFP